MEEENFSNGLDDLSNAIDVDGNDIKLPNDENAVQAPDEGNTEDTIPRVTPPLEPSPLPLSFQRKNEPFFDGGKTGADLTFADDDEIAKALRQQYDLPLVVPNQQDYINNQVELFQQKEFDEIPDGVFRPPLNQWIFSMTEVNLLMEALTSLESAEKKRASYNDAYLNKKIMAEIPDAFQDVLEELLFDRFQKDIGKRVINAADAALEKLQEFKSNGKSFEHPDVLRELLGTSIRYVFNPTWEKEFRNPASAPFPAFVKYFARQDFAPFESIAAFRPDSMISISKLGLFEAGDIPGVAGTPRVFLIKSPLIKSPATQTPILLHGITMRLLKNSIQQGEKVHAFKHVEDAFLHKLDLAGQEAKLPLINFKKGENKLLEALQINNQFRKALKQALQRALDDKEPKLNNDNIIVITLRYDFGSGKLQGGNDVFVPHAVFHVPFNGEKLDTKEIERLWGFDKAQIDEPDSRGPFGPDIAVDASIFTRDSNGAGANPEWDAELDDPEHMFNAVSEFELDARRQSAKDYNQTLFTHRAREAPSPRFIEYINHVEKAAAVPEDSDGDVILYGIKQTMQHLKFGDGRVPEWWVQVQDPSNVQPYATYYSPNKSSLDVKPDVPSFQNLYTFVRGTKYFDGRNDTSVSKPGEGFTPIAYLAAFVVDKKTGLTQIGSGPAARLLPSDDSLTQLRLYHILKDYVIKDASGALQLKAFGSNADGVDSSASQEYALPCLRNEAYIGDARLFYQQKPVWRYSDTWLEDMYEAGADSQNDAEFAGWSGWSRTLTDAERSRLAADCMKNGLEHLRHLRCTYLDLERICTSSKLLIAIMSSDPNGATRKTDDDDDAGAADQDDASDNGFSHLDIFPKLRSAQLLLSLMLYRESMFVLEHTARASKYASAAVEIAQLYCLIKGIEAPSNAGNAARFAEQLQNSLERDERSDELLEAINARGLTIQDLAGVNKQKLNVFEALQEFADNLRGGIGANSFKEDDKKKPVLKGLNFERITSASLVDKCIKALQSFAFDHKSDREPKKFWTQVKTPFVRETFKAMEGFNPCLLLTCIATGSSSNDKPWKEQIVNLNFLQQCVLALCNRTFVPIAPGPKVSGSVGVDDRMDVAVAPLAWEDCNVEAGSAYKGGNDNEGDDGDDEGDGKEEKNNDRLSALEILDMMDAAEDEAGDTPETETKIPETVVPPGYGDNNAAAAAALERNEKRKANQPNQEAPRNTRRGSRVRVVGACPVEVGQYEFDYLRTKDAGNCFYESIEKVLSNGTTAALLRQRTAEFFTNGLSVEANRDTFKQVAESLRNAISDPLLRQLSFLEEVGAQPALLELAQTGSDKDLMASYGSIVAAVRGKDLKWVNAPEMAVLAFLLQRRFCIYTWANVTIRNTLLFKQTIGQDTFQPIHLVHENYAGGNDKEDHYSGLRVYQRPSPSGQQPEGAATGAAAGLIAVAMDDGSEEEDGDGEGDFNNSLISQQITKNRCETLEASARLFNVHRYFAWSVAEQELLQVAIGGVTDERPDARIFAGRSKLHPSSDIGLSEKWTATLKDFYSPKQSVEVEFDPDLTPKTRSWKPESVAVSTSSGVGAISATLPRNSESSVHHKTFLKERGLQTPAELLFAANGYLDRKTVVQIHNEIYGTVEHSGAKDKQCVNERFDEISKQNFEQNYKIFESLLRAEKLKRFAHAHEEHKQLLEAADALRMSNFEEDWFTYGSLFLHFKDISTLKVLNKDQFSPFTVDDVFLGFSVLQDACSKMTNRTRKDGTGNGRIKPASLSEALSSLEEARARVKQLMADITSLKLQTFVLEGGTLPSLELLLPDLVERNAVLLPFLFVKVSRADSTASSAVQELYDRNEGFKKLIDGLDAAYQTQKNLLEEIESLRKRAKFLKRCSEEIFASVNTCCSQRLVVPEKDIEHYVLRSMDALQQNGPSFVSKSEVYDELPTTLTREYKSFVGDTFRGKEGSVLVGNAEGMLFPDSVDENFFNENATPTAVYKPPDKTNAGYGLWSSYAEEAAAALVTNGRTDDAACVDGFYKWLGDGGSRKFFSSKISKNTLLPLPSFAQINRMLANAVPSSEGDGAFEWYVDALDGIETPFFPSANDSARRQGMLSSIKNGVIFVDQDISVSSANMPANVLPFDGFYKPNQDVDATFSAVVDAVSENIADPAEFWSRLDDIANRESDLDAADIRSQIAKL
jgi:hypothetical protein